jgi:ribA/ribD-fused uncharacterized protein
MRGFVSAATPQAAAAAHAADGDSDGDAVGALCATTSHAAQLQRAIREAREERCAPRRAAPAPVHAPAPAPAPAAAPPRVVKFWHPDGPNAVLSQWADTPFRAPLHPGTKTARFATAEHWMMFNKATLFGDHACAAAILAAPDARAARDIGRRVRGFRVDAWNAVRLSVATAGARAKAAAHASVRDALLASGDAVLAEASPTDAVWGIGMRAEDPRSDDPSAWPPGGNLLGRVLIAVREELRAAAAAEAEAAAAAASSAPA